ncbi:hypothetical protein LPH50_04695 [Xylella taiwanensis]|uniref:Uncharacterized protein n=3 Tax=Xylella taiwanensis TaxID=1444770 RepID=A0ABS8TU60_9GAMM|nr:hypothetical protein [Xylella taiwanensis]MCD8455275.1 hypothetical protein [Xylella taiwanensis]MCD8457682.1 hypothetical protein [Xylella taiwanensis]MCD8464120.1 hypothetical protein [Xylella taiwanensis]MCD8464322.1 hypothetical protein [Xylella taiwanensis]MCD8468117.1 hypothetical protein [Xylella taiwanensis]
MQQCMGAQRVWSLSHQQDDVFKLIDQLSIKASDGATWVNREMWRTQASVAAVKRYATEQRLVSTEKAIKPLFKM